TPGYDEPLTGARLFVPRHFKNRIDRFLLRLVDERARVDHQHVGLCGILRELVSCVAGESEHHLGVDEVLGATERDETYLHCRFQIADCRLQIADCRLQIYGYKRYSIRGYGIVSRT